MCIMQEYSSNLSVKFSGIGVHFGKNINMEHSKYGTFNIFTEICGYSLLKLVYIGR